MLHWEVGRLDDVVGSKLWRKMKRWIRKTAAVWRMIDESYIDVDGRRMPMKSILLLTEL